MAGHRGLGALAFAFVSPEAARVWVNAYYNEFTKRLEKLTDYQTNPALACVAGFMCAPTDEEARVKADGWTFFQFALGFYNKVGPLAPGERNLWEEYQAWKETPEGQKGASGLIGSPETIRKKLYDFKDANVDQIILLNPSKMRCHLCDPSHFLLITLRIVVALRRKYLEGHWK